MNDTPTPTAFEAFAARDLWWENRQKTSAMQGAWWLRLYVWLLRLLFPKKFGLLEVRRFGTGLSLLCVDLNKYRPDVNVEMLIDQGVRLFCLRVVGPTRWVYGAWNYEVDATFAPYYERIRKYAKEKNLTVWICGYGVHNAWGNEINNYQGPDPQLRLLKDATRNHLCDLYSWDDEVAVCWKDGKETTITAVNLVKSISILMEQTLLEMERHPDGSYKMPVHYSANWFMKKYAPADYQAWLDRANKDPESRRFLTWRAWLPITFTETFATIGALFAKLLTPTGTQENAFLRMGSELAADLWQCTFTAKGPWCGPQSAGGIDASIGYGPSASIQSFAYNANLSLSPTPPDDGGDGEEEVPEGLEELAADVALLRADVNNLLAWQGRVRA